MRSKARLNFNRSVKTKESNWLLEPQEPFDILMRIYPPKTEVLNGQYKIPGVVKAK